MTICFAIYTEWLLTKHNLKFLKIKHSTVKFYLKTAARDFTTKNVFDPRLTCFGTDSDLLLNVYHKAKRWETMPNRREPLTI